MTLHHYFAHGLHIASELACPELWPTPADDTPPDVLMRLGATPAALENPAQQNVLYEAKPQQFLFKPDRIANYWVYAGREIVIQPAAASDADEIRLFLLGTVFAALLQQRGCFTLHGSAVVAAQGAAVFVGPSGSGKSTLAAALRQRGHRLLCDDVTTIHFDDQRRPQVFPTSTHVKLWADSSAKLMVDTTSMRRVGPLLEKYAIPHLVDCDQRPIPLAVIYALTCTQARDITLEVICGRQKLKMLTDQIYRAEFTVGLGVRATHLQQALQIANHCRLYTVKRPSAHFLLDELVAGIEDTWAEAAQESVRAPLCRDLESRREEPKRTPGDRQATGAGSDQNAIDPAADRRTGCGAV